MTASEQACFAITRREPSQRFAPRAIALWLLACCALVFAMVVVRGVTHQAGAVLPFAAALNAAHALR